MKHAVTSLNTKKALAASFKKLMETKPLSKITVSEIIRDCGVNRKTFYYHFEDIYALLKWMLEQETVEVIRHFDLLVDYEEAILFVIDYVDTNQHMLNCMFDSIGQDGLKQFFYDDFIGCTRTIIDGIEQNLGLRVEEDFKQFLSQFYSEALAGILMDCFRNRTGRSREAVLQYLLLTLQSSIPNVLRAKAEEEKKNKP